MSDSRFTSLSAPERWSWIGVGAALLGYAALRRGALAIPAAAAGSYLLLRGAANRRPGAELAHRPGRRRLARSVMINRPPDEVYAAWRRLENLPRFFPHLESVTVRDEKYSHWVARSRLSGKLEWDCEITDDQPGRTLAWRSAAGMAFQHSGEIHFRPGPPQRGTRVELRWSYRVPGAWRGMLALVGEAPGQVAREGLRRFKQWMEAGEIATIAGQPHGPRTRLAEMAPLFSPAPPVHEPTPLRPEWLERTSTA